MKNSVLVCLISCLSLFSQKSFLSAPVNSILYNESDPVIGGVGNTLLFLSESSQEPVPSWSVSYGGEGRWGTSVSLDALNYSNKTIKNISPSLTFDETKIYFSSNRHGGIGSGDIWIITKNGNNWDAKATNIGMPINSIANEIDPFLAPDDKTLFFVRQNLNKTSDNLSCGDIYMSTFVSNKWTSPVKLPEPINTGYEAAPKMLSDNKTLLFASARVGGQGSFDVYMSRLNENNIWSDPVPLTFFNTPSDDRKFSLPASGNLLYSSMKNKEAQDVVRFIVPESYQPLSTHISLEAVLDAQTKTQIPAKLTITNKTQHFTQNILISAEKLNRLFFKTGNEYELCYTDLAGKYLHKTEYLDLRDKPKISYRKHITELSTDLKDVQLIFPNFIVKQNLNAFYLDEVNRVNEECKKYGYKAQLWVANSVLALDSVSAQVAKFTINSIFTKATVQILPLTSDPAMPKLKIGEALIKFEKDQ